MQFEWIDFYMEFANKLYDYKNDRKSLIEKIISVFNKIGMKLPKLESDGKIVDIDPFTIFGLFNKGITKENRMTILKGIAQEFKMDTKVPNDFSGIPVLNNQQAAFYGFKGDRKDSDIDNLWEIFCKAIDLSNDYSNENKESFKNIYDICLNQYCVKWNITMALFWIRPFTFMNLDSKNRQFILNNEDFSDEFVASIESKIKKVPNGEDYLFIIDSFKKLFEAENSKFKNFAEFSNTAWLDDKIEEKWFPKNYTPGLSVDDWINLINDKEIFTENNLSIMKRLLDIGGQATCKELSLKYGENPQFYNSSSVNLAKRIYKKTNCSLMKRGEESYRWWPILYVGKNTSKDEDGQFIWKLRDELLEALNQIDLTKINLYPKPKFWKMSHGNNCISNDEAEIFENKQVIVIHDTTKSKGGSKTTQWQEFKDTLKKGDFFYLCRGNRIKLLGQIDSDEIKLNSEKQNGWYERSYKIIAQSINNSSFNKIDKWWTPNDNSTCIQVPDKEMQLFEDNILKPYFNKTVDELLNIEEIHYWFLNANPKIWSMANMPVDEVQNYTMYNDNGNKRRVFQNFLDVKKGDKVIGYESTPVKQIVALLEITAEQDGEKICFKKTEGLSSPIDYSKLKENADLQNMEYLINPQGSLFKLTKNEYEVIYNIIRESNPTIIEEYKKYNKLDFLNEVYMEEEKYDRLLAVLKRKKNIILQGAPGVGKTFAAKRLAYSMMGEVDDNRIEFVQFHQNYSYEDFVMGYKPIENGFELRYGIFYQFCKKASNHPEKDYFFIIDEINRGNMSKIFGELLMLIESDYRDKSITLAYNGLGFSVPKNLHIIGMMNTADRSLAMIDYALRRRFSFFDMEPGFDSKGFKDYQNNFSNETFNHLIDKIKELNEEIKQDKSLGKGFCIGHSYFCNAEKCTDEWMEDIIEFDILPMLREYWFDESAKLQHWEDNLNGVLK